jgi:hypothetical protein
MRSHVNDGGASFTWLRTTPCAQGSARSGAQLNAGDAHLRNFQQQYGTMPSQLADFIQSGDARWDARLCAWLLYLCQQVGGSGTFWGLYLQSLPSEGELNLLCSYTPQEQMLLQVPW